MNWSNEYSFTNSPPFIIACAEKDGAGLPTNTDILIILTVKSFAKVLNIHFIEQ